MNKPIKILLSLSAILLILFIIVIFHDYTQFQENQLLIMESLKSSDPAKLQASWFSVVVIRAVEFLVPSLIFGFTALAFYVHDNRKPKKKNNGF